MKPNFTHDEIKHIFTYHAPTPFDIELYTLIREKALEFALLLNNCLPESDEKITAINYLKTSVMWANASVALNKPIL